MTWEQTALLLLKLTVLWGIALLATAALTRASAAMRHLILACAIGASLGLPALTWIVPQWKVDALERAAVEIEMPVAAPAAPPGAAAVQAQASSPATAAPPQTGGSPLGEMPPPVRTGTSRWEVPWGPVLLGVWLAGIAVAAMRLFAGLWRLRSLRKSARRLDLPMELAGHLRRIELLEGASESSMPLTWGWRTPRILFPAGFTAWSPERTQLVLAHEMAHIERRDWPVQMLGEIARVVYWFHPLAWIALARLRQESERAADDRVLGAGFDGAGYGLHLIEIARLCQTPLGTSAATLAMATRSSLERRLTALVNPILDRSPLSGRQMAWSAAALAAMLLPLAAVTAGQIVDYEISGRVVDSSTGQGVEGVSVRLAKLPDLDPNAKNRQPGPIQLGSAGKIETDAQGRFRFPDLVTGHYLIQAEKAGYGAAPGQNGGPTLALEEATISGEKPLVEIEFSMRGGGSVSGQLIDADTGEPVVGVRVAAELIRNLLGQRSSTYRSKNSARTDSEGRFTIANVPAGEYAIAVEPFATEPNRWMENFTDDDLTVVETGYESRYFPGGPGLDAVLPVIVATGAPTSAGTFRVKRVPLYRARIGLPQPACPVGATFRLRLFPGVASTLISGPSVMKEAACGSALLARGLPEGSYALSGSTITPAQQTPQPAKGPVVFSISRDATAADPADPFATSPDAVYAVDSLLIRDENVNLDLHPRKGYDLEGSVIVADGAGDLDLTGSRVGLTFVEAVPVPRGLPIFRLDENRRFSMPNEYPGVATVRMMLLPPGAYVREVRYNGVAQPDLRFDFTGQGKLEVVVDTGAGQISGLVKQGDAAVPGARVALVEWPMIPDDRLQSLNEVTAKDGQFQTYLAPGEYRVFALTEAQYGRMGEPGMLERLAAGGQRLTVARNSSLSITLNVSDPSR